MTDDSPIDFIDHLPGRLELNWSAKLEKLRSRPGRWGMLASADVGQRLTIYSRRERLMERYGKRGFEFAARTVDTRTYLYGRFVGENREHVKEGDDE